MPHHSDHSLDTKKHMENPMHRFYPEQLKIVDENHSHSQWMNVVAAYRKQILGSTEATWLLFEPDMFLFSALFYALLSSGKSVLLPQNAQPEHIRSVKKHAQASIGASIIQPDIISHREWPESAPLQLEIDPSSEISFFTSGSTGEPKIIKKQFEQLLIEVDTLEATFGDNVNGTVFLSTVSHQHIYGFLFKFLWPTTKSHSFNCHVYEYPEHLLNEINRLANSPVTLIASPAHLHRLYLDNVLIPAKDLINTVFSSGGPLDADKNLHISQQITCDIFEVFGSTETGGIAWRKRTSIDDDLWRTFPKISVEYQPGTDLLLLTSPYVTQSPYFADDRIKIVDKNQFVLVGRADDIVKIEEKRVSLNDVQNRLKQHDCVFDAYVLVTNKGRKQLAAVIELNDEGKRIKGSISKHQLNRMFQQYLASWFEAVVLPKRFRYPEQLPYNAQGKLNKLVMESDFD